MQKLIFTLPALRVMAAFSALFLLFQSAALFAETGSKPHAPRKGTYAGAMETEYPNWFSDSFLDIRDDVATAAQNGKRLMIMFTQNGCPYCNAMVERNLAQKDIETLVRGHFDVVAMNLVGDRAVTNVDGKHYTEKTFAEALKVQFTPTILFLNEKGETILRLNGYLPPDKFKVALDYLVEKSGQLSYRDFLELNSPPPTAGVLNKEAFFLAPPYKLARKGGGKAKPLAVFFEQKDCPNCDVLHRKVLVDAETRKLIAHYDAVQLDMWDKTTSLTTPDGRVTTARDWAKKLDVKYAPTIVLFDAKGVEIIRTEAFFKIFHTQSFFDYVQSGAYKQQPHFQRYISRRSELMREQGKDVDIWHMEDEADTQKK